ncbi:protein FAM47E-like [Ostrea edulis]|uniref:protein FAM47E-like n=1 Tax=Ostrea edulis TaxID=37623 RepID=UPI0024AF35AC|nr:protein FAM47E-like [Ostrea edulis]
MAERKYDLALVNTAPGTRIREKPWYKERLQTKYIKSLKPEDTSKSLLGKDWIFVKDGLDDFRDGLPPPVKGDILIKGSKGPGPSLKGSSENVSPVKQPAVRNRFSKHQICYSRSTPLQQNRRDHIDEIEYSLVLHPLALYPHLEESVPPEVYSVKKVSLQRYRYYPYFIQCSTERKTINQNLSLLHHLSLSVSSLSLCCYLSLLHHLSLSVSPLSLCCYLSLLHHLSLSVSPLSLCCYLSLLHHLSLSVSPLSLCCYLLFVLKEEHIKKVTKDFCDWVAESLGGDQNKFEESTIMSLFASGYETKPALSVPIHVVELTNVPQELRQQATVSNQQTNKNIPPPEKASTNWKYSSQYEPSWVKFKYGAWYLDPTSWSKRRDDELLENPKDIKDKEMSEAKKKSKELNHVIAQSQGAKLFMDWVNDPKRQIDPKSEHSKPEFLDEVAKIQEQAVIDEQKRLKAEQDAKQRKLYTRKRTETEQSVACVRSGVTEGIVRTTADTRMYLGLTHVLFRLCVLNNFHIIMELKLEKNTPCF